MLPRDDKITSFNLDSSSSINKNQPQTEFQIEDNWIPDNAKKGYHEQRLSQSKWAFRLSFWGSIAGFVIIVVAIRHSTGLDNVEWPGIVSGVVIEAVSALFYGLSNRANEKITEFFSELTKDSNVKAAMKLCEQVKNDDVRDCLLVKLSLHLSGISEEKICKYFKEICNVEKKTCNRSEEMTVLNSEKE